MADSRQEDSFKVVDRRLFTDEGELRKEAVEQERRDEEAAARKTAAQAKTQAQKQSAPSADGGAAQPEIAPSRSFQMLVDFLTRNAAAMMGGMADPRTGQAFLDLEGAREMIDMLDELREKTHGNLAKEDEGLLVEVVGSLKLTFMEVSRAAADAMSKKAAQQK